jgi:hypothetical protein
VLSQRGSCLLTLDRISQYKYRINAVWKMRKNISSSKKAALLEMHRARKVAGKSTALTYKGRPVDDNKIRRFAKDRLRQDRFPRDDAGTAETSASCIASKLTASKMLVPLATLCKLTSELTRI